MTPARPRLWVWALLLVLTLVAGCSGPTPQPRPEGAATTAGPGLGYVALGDSFTAAPYVPVTDFADGCLRSDGNYPALLAVQLDAQLRDVSCSGADTGDLTGPDPERGLAPQLRAVVRDTDLVTVGIGGNDEELFGTLVRGCAATTGGSCGEVAQTLGGVGAVLERTRSRVARVLRLVSQRAPGATVVLVGYPRLVDPGRSCPALPLPVASRGFLVRLERQLNAGLRAAAQDAGAEFVDLYAASAGHEICSAEPWVNGRRTDEQRALAFHPFAVEQRAVAAAVLDVWERPGK